MVASAITLPTNPIEYFDTLRSPANPHNKNFSFYVYGTYPLHLTKLVSVLAKKDTYDGITIVGRMLSAIADMHTVIIVFLIASYIGKRHTAGLIAAFIYAVSVLPIQLSHFFTVDPFTTLFTTLALWQLVRGRFGITLGIATGLSIASKVSSVILLPIIAVAFIMSLSRGQSAPERRKRRIRFLRQVLVFGVSMIAVVRLFYPYLFTGVSLNPKVLTNWKQLASFNQPTTSFPPGIQWIGVPVTQPMWDAIVWGLGFPVGILTVIAVYYWCRQTINKRAWNGITLLLLWIVVAFGYQAIQFPKPMRYFWIVYPGFAVLSGTFLARLPIMRSSVFLILLVLLIWPFSYLSIYRQPNTRIAASTWVYANIPANATIAWEHWDDPVPFAIGALNPLHYRQPQVPVFDPENAEKWKKISDVLSAADYVVISSNRGYGSILRAGKRFPQTVAYYERLFDGSLGFHQVKQFISRPHLALPGISWCVRIPGFSYGRLSQTHAACAENGVYLVDDYSDETFTVYDHPQVTILKNVGRYPKEKLMELLSERD